MNRNSKTPSKNLASESRSQKLKNLIGGGKKWSFEKTLAGQHITHYDGVKGYNATAPILPTVCVLYLNFANTNN